MMVLNTVTIIHNTEDYREEEEEECRLNSGLVSMRAEWWKYYRKYEGAPYKIKIDKNTWTLYIIIWSWNYLHTMQQQ